MKNIILLIFIMVFLYYLPEIIYKFILDLFSIKRTFTGYGYNLKYNSNLKKIKNNLYNSKYKCLFSPINSSNLINDLNDVEKRHLLYLEFRDYFNKSRCLIENNYNVYSGSNNF